MRAQTSPYLPGRGGMLVGAASLIANVGLASCGDPKPVRIFRVFVSDHSGGCELRVDGKIISYSDLIAIARQRDGRRVDARIVSPASGIAPQCARLAQRAVEHARFATVTFASRPQTRRSGAIAASQSQIAAERMKD